MNELIEGSRGLAVIADDFVVVGYGESPHAAIKDHDGNLLAFPEKCDECGHLKRNKLQLRMKEVIERKIDVPTYLRAYFNVHDELVVQGDSVFTGLRLVVSCIMRKELMSVAHATYIGIEGYLRRVRECLFWPRMASDYVSKCDVCLAHRTSQTKEPLPQHDVIARPSAKLTADLCELHGRTLLVVTDYFRNYIEMARLSATSTQAVVRELKTMFARFGISEILVTDNGPQFSSNDFQVFARGWSFNYVTTSPRYPQSNGKAENAVRTVNRLFEKYKVTGMSEFEAPLDWRNTPPEGMDTNPL